jgi:glycosyltransferase involved in cell wall biosynthesis
MNQMKMAVFSVFYPGIEDYVEQFISSLSEQTDPDFVLYLINDGMIDFEKIVSNFKGPLKIIEETNKATPAAIMKKGIQWLIRDRMDAVIFADSDDYFAVNRVDQCKKILIKNDCVFHELMLFGDGMKAQIPMFNNRYLESSRITKDDILHSNCLGFGNTGIKLTPHLLHWLDKIPNHIIAFDWIFFAFFLNTDKEAVYTNKTHTYYRQHSENIASQTVFSEKQIISGINIKIEHYSILADVFDEERYVTLRNIFKELKLKLEKNNQLFQKYCRLVQENQTTGIPLWWELIKPIEGLEQ